MQENYPLVKGIAVQLVRGIKDAVLTPELLADVVDRALLALGSSWSGAERAELVKDLETQFNVWIGRPQTLDDSRDHKPWLLQKRGQIVWKYWERYKLLLTERWPKASIDGIEEITDEILARLEDPAREGAWDRRGLVVGHVQSGKTANYIGLINKAVDAGYRVIVVLAGVHKSLRSQTQIRLDEGFLGYESVAAVAANQGLRAVGVGRIAPNLTPDTITNRSDDGDFKRTVAERFQINPGGNPLLFVIKKNASVLKNLLEWVEWAAKSKDPETGRPVVRNVPLLVIDDEADHASVDTKAIEFDEDGKADQEHNPTIINGQIRRLLHCFEKVAYVGYTATPFANIFIHESVRTREEGEDLFPRSFIINLPASSDYVGPLKVFGMDAHPEADLQAVDGLPIVRRIADYIDPGQEEVEERELKGWMPPRHKKEHVPRSGGELTLPASLQEAILAFVISCAARRVRGQTTEHNSMLIHVTRFTDVQERVHGQVKAFLDDLLLRLKFGEGKTPDPVLGRMRRLWDEDFEPTTEKIGGASGSWLAVEGELWNAVSAITLKRVNGTAPDILDYESHRETGLSVIAIGGDKLARGLTLEGLSVSYFLRASRMYDTLMQMGRWFGYRPGYLDLCRMYMTAELDEWFRHITAASEELRQEFERMVSVGGTPREYGLRVKSHPALLITSPVKMRYGTELDLSFAGDITETTVFGIDERSVADNLATVAGLCSKLVKQVGNPERDPVRERPGGRRETWDGSYVWSNVPAETVVGFFNRIVTSEFARKVNGKLMAEFIERAAGHGELSSWTVALVGKGEGTSWELPQPLQRIGMIERKGAFPGGAKRFHIRRLLNPRDEAIDLGLDEYEAALKETKNRWSPDAGRYRSKEEPDIPSGPMLRQVRPKTRALLILYLLDHTVIAKNAEDAGVSGAPAAPLVGFAVSFPAQATATTVRYRVNNVFWDQEYGAAA